MTVRIGFIGVGGMAEGHIQTFKQIDEAKVTAVFDINQDRSREIAEKYGAVSYASKEELMDSGQVDALFICTPPFAREGIEEAAVERGLHLLAEKPVGLRMEDALRKEQLIRNSGLIHSSGYCLRYWDIVARAKEYMADKQVDLVVCQRIGGMPGVPWWRMMEKSGGQLVEQTTHQVDLIRYMASDFKEVYAIHAQRSIQKRHPEATAYDAGTLSFTLESGAIGSLTNSCLGKYVGQGELSFYGDDFFVGIDGSSLRIKDDHQDVTFKAAVNVGYEQNLAFVRAIQTGNQDLVLCSYTEAMKTLAVTLAANESAEKGTTVSIRSLMG